MHNSLPSNAEMKRRHIAKESHCEMCGDPDETLYHIIYFLMHNGEEDLDGT